MKVTLRNTWFAPGEITRPDAIRVFSGRKFDKGVHYMPNSMLQYLPSSAIVEDGPVDFQPSAQGTDWRLAADDARAAVEAASAAHKEADEKLANKRAAVAKAREAKLVKKLEREAADAAQ